MAAMRGDQDMVARTKIALAFALDPETRRAGKEQHPFVVLLIIRLVRRCRLAGRDDPLYAHALARKQLGEDLFVGARRQVAEKIDHEAVSGLICGDDSEGRACARAHTKSMIPQSVQRFSEKIMLKQEARAG